MLKELLTGSAERSLPSATTGRCSSSSSQLKGATDVVRGQRIRRRRSGET